MNKNNLFILLFCLTINLIVAQNPPIIEVGLGLGGNVSWIKGTADFDIDFTKKTLPNINLYVGRNIGKRHQIAVGFRLDAVMSNYEVPAYDINLKPIQLKLLTSNTYTTLYSAYKVLVAQKYKTRLGVGIALNLIESSRMACLENCGTYDIPIYFPFYASFFSKNNVGLQFSVHQPLFRIGSCDFEIETMYLHGLNNINKYSDENRLYTRNIMMFFNCVLRPKKKR